jgi:hypothetical protein
MDTPLDIDIQSEIESIASTNVSSIRSIRKDLHYQIIKPAISPVQFHLGKPYNQNKIYKMDILFKKSIPVLQTPFMTVKNIDLESKSIYLGFNGPSEQSQYTQLYDFIQQFDDFVIVHCFSNSLPIFHKDVKMEEIEGFFKKTIVTGRRMNDETMKVRIPLHDDGVSYKFPIFNPNHQEINTKLQIGKSYQFLLQMTRIKILKYYMFVEYEVLQVKAPESLSNLFKQKQMFIETDIENSDSDDDDFNNDGAETVIEFDPENDPEPLSDDDNNSDDLQSFISNNDLIMNKKNQNINNDSNETAELFNNIESNDDDFIE